MNPTAEELEEMQRIGLSRLAIAEILEVHDDDVKLIFSLPDELKKRYIEEAQRQRKKVA